MKKLFSMRNLTALLFLLFLALFFLLSLKPFLRESYFAIVGSGGTAQAESRFNEFLPGKSFWVNLNGGVHKLLGSREVNERYLMDNGQMTYIIPELDMGRIAQNTADFAEAVEERGIPFLYVNLLFKVDDGDKKLPQGVEDFSNENADRFLALLREDEVPCVDLREIEKAEGLDHYSLFFPTDHHWTPEAGLWAAGEVSQALGELDASLRADAALFDLSHYDCETYEQVFLGSHGRRVGAWYAGLDDLDVLTPRFETALRFSVPSEGIEREGSFQDTMLFPEKLTEEDKMNSAAYDVYCGGQYDLLRVENLLHGNGKRLLVLQDSFSLVVIPFLSLGYEQVDYLDLRLWGGDLLDYMDETRPDAVLILYNPGALEDNNTVMFEFLR